MARPPERKPLAGLTRLLVAVQTQSVAGDALFEISLYWFVAERTGRALPVGLLALVAAASGFAAGLLGGVFVDRVRIQRLLPLLDWLRMSVVGGLGLAFGWFDAPLWILYPSVALSAGTTVLYSSSVRKLVANVEPRDNLMRANSNFQLFSALAGIGGFGLAGVIYPVAGIRLTFLLDALTFLVAGVAVFASKPVTVPGLGPPLPINLKGYFEQLWAGAKTIAGARILRMLLLVSLSANFLLAPIDVLGPTLVRGVLHENIRILAILEVAVMSGRITGSYLARRLKAENPFSILRWTTAIMGLAALLVALSPRVATVPVSYFVMGIAASTSAVIIITAVQRATPPSVQGRVFSLQGAAMSALPPLGAVLFTGIADTTNVLTAFTGIGAGLAIVAAGIWWASRLVLERPETVETVP